MFSLPGGLAVGTSAWLGAERISSGTQPVTWPDSECAVGKVIQVSVPNVYVYHHCQISFDQMRVEKGSSRNLN